MNRRQFAKKTAMASAMLTAATIPGFSGIRFSPSMNLKKGIMWGGVKVGKTIMERFQAAKQAGFDGIEVDSHLDRNEVLKARDATGLIIPSVCDSQHWKLLLSSPDPKVREDGVAALKVALEDAKTFGADTVLLVPGRVTDTISYDECWNRSSEEIKKAVPIAEKLNVRIAVENVWNNFLLSPLEAARRIVFRYWQYSCLWMAGTVDQDPRKAYCKDTYQGIQQEDCRFTGKISRIQR
jgi:hexulose-6-phosphate isomerase